MQVCACFNICLSKNVVLQACGRLSEGSSRATHFYELEVQVKGAILLEESLVGANHLLLEPREFSFLLPGLSYMKATADIVLEIPAGVSNDTM